MSEMNFSTEEELPIISLKEYELNSNVKGYHAYMMKVNLTLGEFLKTQFPFFFVEATKTLAKLKLLRKE